MTTPGQVVDDPIKTKQNNQLFLELLDGGQTKTAGDVATEYTRMRVRESSFVERILPSQKLSNGDLDKQVNSEHPMKVVSREPGSPAAVTVPYGALPVEHYFRGDRYAVHFDRIMTPKFIKDVGELRTTDIDIRQILADNAALDMDEELDSKFIGVVDAIVGAENSTVAATGAVQNRHINTAVTRESIFEMLKILPRTPTRAETATVLCNNITIKDVAKWGRDEFGGDIAQEVMINGFAERTFGGARFLVSIKQDLIPDGVFYLFTEKRAFMVEWWSWRECGLTIGNVASVGRCRIAA
jgi:hypothetical protein